MRSSRIRIIAGLVLVALIVVLTTVLPVKEYLVWFLGWAQANGPLGAVLLGLLYIPACLFFIPGSLLTLGAGFAFGVVWGTIAVSCGSVLGATAAFVAGRTLARGFIEQRVASSPSFAAIDKAVAEQGIKIVLLTRLSPIFPFNLLNYAYGLTRVRLRDYVLASWVGMFPGTVMYVYLGSAVKNVADLAMGKVQGGTGQTVLFFVGLAATVAVTIYVTRVAKRALNNAVAESNAPAGDTPERVGTSRVAIQSRVNVAKI
jgi:uncharacterized membrane protein YdjX (TVP38/TMEM64 family)